MANLPPNIQSILDDLEMVGDSGRPMILIDFAEHFQPVPPEVATRPYSEANHVQECESDAYVFPVPRPDGHLDFYFDVLNPQGVSAKAFSQILKASVDGQSAETIAAIPDEIVPLLFGRGISMGKGLGLQGILNLVKRFARQHQGGG